MGHTAPVTSYTPEGSALVAPVQPAARRRTGLIVAAAAAVLLAAGVGAYLLVDHDMTVRGTLVITNLDDLHVDPTSGDTCTGQGPDADITAGASVTITDGASATVGLGQLDRGHYNNAQGCVFTWTAKGVTAGKRFYGIEVGHHGVVKFTEAELHSPVALRLP